MVLFSTLNVIGTRHMASEDKKSNSRSLSTRVRNGRVSGHAVRQSTGTIAAARRQPPRHRFAVCVINEDYPASLELRKLYRVVEDAFARQHDLIRIIDESGEDYLYPSSYFVGVELPEAVRQALQRMASQEAPTMISPRAVVRQSVTRSRV